MKSPAMLQLNPLGGFVKIKNHLKKAHNIREKDMGKYSTLTDIVTNQKIYHYLREDVR